MADPKKLKIDFAANQKARSVTVQGFRDGLAQYGPFVTFRGLNRDGSVQDRNNNQLGIVSWDATGPLSRGGAGTEEEWTSFLSPAGHGHRNMVKEREGGEEAAEAKEQSDIARILNAVKPSDGVFEVEGVRADGVGVNLANGEENKEIATREDGVASL